MSDNNWKVVSYKNKKKSNSQIGEKINLDKNFELTQTNPNQDLNVIIIGKPQIKKKSNSYQKEASAIKIDEMDNIIQIKKISQQMSKDIINARINKKWTQQQLAHNSTIDIKTIIEIEKGGGLYNPTIFNKLCKSLGVNIDRKCIIEKK